MNYDLELDKVISKIKEEKAKLVCIQLPDGLKNKATEIVNFIEKNTDAKCLIWMSTNYGICDLPVGLENLNIDLLIPFGHSIYGFEKQVKEYIKLHEK